MTNTELTGQDISMILMEIIPQTQDKKGEQRKATQFTA